MNNGGSWLPEEELKGLSENFFDDLINHTDLLLEEDMETGNDDDEGDWDAKFENLVPPPLDVLSSEFTHGLRKPVPTLVSLFMLCPHLHYVIWIESISV